MAGTAGSTEGAGVDFQTLLERTSGVSEMAAFNMSPIFKGTPKYRGKNFGIGSNEIQHGGVLEPPHTHITLPEGEVKIWTAAGPNKDQVTLANFSPSVPKKELGKILEVVSDNRVLFVNKWLEWAKISYPQDPTIKDYDLR